MKKGLIYFFFILSVLEIATFAADKKIIFTGKETLIVVNGYSTSFHWPKVLQRKLDRYHNGKKVIEVKSATQGSTPIAKWMDLTENKGLQVWNKIDNAIASKQGRPVIVLGQQSLQWALGDRSAGINNSNDSKNIKKGAAVLKQYVDLLHKSGADHVFVSMHIFKHSMEPQISNEKFALAEYLKSKPKNFSAGPDVWQATKDNYPTAFSSDKIHPNSYGAEIMAHYWFETLLAKDGLTLPSWSLEELNQAKTSGGKEMKGTSSGRSRGVPQRVLEKYDLNKDGKLDEKEQEAYEKMKKQRMR